LEGAGHRQVLEEVLAEVGAARGRRGIDDRRGAADRDLVAEAGRHLHVQGDGAVKPDADAGLLEGGEALEARLEVVVPGRQAEEPELAIGPRHLDASALQAGTGDGERHAGQGLTLRVDNRAIDPAGRLRLGGRHGHQDQCDEYPCQLHSHLCNLLSVSSVPAGTRRGHLDRLPTEPSGRQPVIVPVGKGRKDARSSCPTSGLVGLDRRRLLQGSELSGFVSARLRKSEMLDDG